MRLAAIPFLIMSCAALLTGCGRGEIDAKGDMPHNAASRTKSTPTPPPSAEPFPDISDLVKKSVGSAAKHADRSGFSLDFMTYAHGDGLTEAGYEINLYTYNEDHKVSSVTDLSSIARHSNNLVCRAKKIGPKSYAIYFDDTYDSSGTVIYCRLDSTDNRWHWQY